MSEREDAREEIDRKCRTAGCSKESAAKHFRLFALERWDCHPEADFAAWLPTFEYARNLITAWNCDRTRQAFCKWKTSGRPLRKFANVPPTEQDFRELRELVAKIGQPDDVEIFPS